jgi:GNAT superfamily N-acetyltransferase
MDKSKVVIDQINNKKVESYGIKFFIEKENKEVGRAFLYIMHNDLKKEPFGMLEDLFVNEELRGQGIGNELLKKVIEEAKKIGCYKLVATSRYGKDNIHDWYVRTGFEDFGKEFKMYLNK